MKNETTHPTEDSSNLPVAHHDGIFKVLFNRPNYARAFLESLLPKKIRKKLDFSTLRVSNTNRVDSGLGQDFTDILLLCKTKNGKLVEIPLILEHKSYRPRYGPYQYMHYQDGIWGDQVLTAGKKPTPIIPVVINHSKEKWKPKAWKRYLDGYDRVFKKFTPPGGCIFISLSDLTDEQIKQFEFGFLVAALLLMKHQWDRKYLLENLPDIFTFVESDQSEDNLDNRITNLRYALRYLQCLKVIKWEEAKVKLRNLNLTFEVMDVLEEVKYEGIQIGREEGIKEGIKEGRKEGRKEGIEIEKYLACRNMALLNYKSNDIAWVLDVEEDFVEMVAGQLAKTKTIEAMIKSNTFDDSKIAEKLNVSIFLVEAVRKDLNKKPNL